MTRTLSISRDGYETMLERAHEGAPREVCGVLGGRRTAASVLVESAVPVPNVADEPRARYELDPERQLAAIESLEERGEEVVGFYHSHPDGPAGPSATDRAQATWPDAHYVIVSLPEESVGAWLWTGERFLERPVEID
ncbi:desampylase [Halalkalicoccus salilacus]|uniref:desampylase n=1 Tax=Halalkalicoccus salilacus TaxID=3117459 RepID=UPI00300F74AA